MAIVNPTARPLARSCQQPGLTGFHIPGEFIVEAVFVRIDLNSLVFTIRFVKAP
jgi:hypothetical protein